VVGVPKVSAPPSPAKVPPIEVKKTSMGGNQMHCFRVVKFLNLESSILSKVTGKCGGIPEAKMSISGGDLDLRVRVRVRVKVRVRIRVRVRVRVRIKVRVRVRVRVRLRV